MTWMQGGEGGGREGHLRLLPGDPGFRVGLRGALCVTCRGTYPNKGHEGAPSRLHTGSECERGGPARTTQRAAEPTHNAPASDLGGTILGEHLESDRPGLGLQVGLQATAGRVWKTHLLTKNRPRPEAKRAAPKKEPWMPTSCTRGVLTQALLGRSQACFPGGLCRFPSSSLQGAQTAGLA